SPFPEVYGGVGLNTEFRGFNLRADFNYQAGNYMYNNTYFDLMNLSPGHNGDNYHVDAVNYWQNPGDTNVFQAPSIQGFQYTDQFIEKGDYILFRSLELGYSFNKDLFKNLPITGIRVYGQVHILAIWTTFHGNPIVGTTSSETSNVTSEGYVSGAASAFTYPMARTYTLGINLTF